MLRRSVVLVRLGCLALALALVSCGAEHTTLPGPSDIPLPLGSGDETRGGLLYDKWWNVNGGAKPTTTHPAYPAAGVRSGDTTWRCKECHGWDYQGVNGAYSTGSHFTGIRGVLDASNQSTQDLFAQISNANHAFSQALSDEDINDLVAFVREGTIDMNQQIEFATKRALGDPAVGKVLYDGSAQCASCHGADGKLLFDLPDVARGNPWETLHKIRWGHPGSAMPSAVAAGFSLDQQVDILAYCQALP